MAASPLGVMALGATRNAWLCAHHLRRTDVAKRQIRSNVAAHGAHRRGTTADGADMGGRSSTIGARGRCHLIIGLIVTGPQTAPARSRPPSNWPKSSLDLNEKGPERPAPGRCCLEDVVEAGVVAVMLEAAVVAPAMGLV